MKLLLSSMFAALLCSPLAFAGDCEKCKDGDKKEETTLAGKCKDGDCDKDEDPALAGKCKDGDCDKDEDPALADCDKCKDKEKEEGTLA